MTSPPSPANVAAGDKLTASKWNTDVVATFAFLLNPPRASVYRSGSLSCADATWTVSGFDSEDEDPLGMHSTSTNTSRLNILYDGSYLVTAIARWTSVAASMGIDIRKNAAGSSVGGSSVATLNVQKGAAGGGSGNGMELVRRVPGLNAGDYLEMFVIQTSGGAVTLIGGAINVTSFAAAWVGIS